MLGILKMYKFYILTLIEKIVYNEILYNTNFVSESCILIIWNQN
jgi:hypothetical protein